VTAWPAESKQPASLAADGDQSSTDDLEIEGAVLRKLARSLKPRGDVGPKPTGLTYQVLSDVP
jgi:hypothetical protein